MSLKATNLESNSAPHTTIEWLYPLSHSILIILSYLYILSLFSFSFALFPKCCKFSLTFSHAFTPLHSLPFCSTPTLYTFTLVHVHFSHWAHHITIAGCSIELVGYSNADWACDVDSRWSPSSYCFVLDSSLISWKSKKQNSVSTSSTEAEYRTYLDTCELLWWMQLLCHISVLQDSPIQVFTDSQSAYTNLNISP